MSVRQTDANRRLLIKASVGLAAAACAPARPVGARERSAVSACAVSPATEQGPFYPTDAVPQRWNLTGTTRPQGQLLYVIGSVSSRHCAPAASAAVVFWQADANGSYNHPLAENSHPLDANFFYFGQWPTRADGVFLLKTIVPSPYLFRGLRRAPHIHFSFLHADLGSLATELYFNRPDDVRRRSTDRIWASRDEDTREAMIVDLHEAGSWPIAEHPIEPEALWCSYAVTLA